MLFDLMVAHIVKTQKPVQIRATFLLFFSATLRSPSPLFMPGENTLQQEFGNQVPGEGARDYKT